MVNIKQNIFSIGETARICGVTEKQIRNWEEKTYIPQAQRVNCGKRSFRQFAEEDFELISKIKHYLDEGFVLSVAARKAKENILQKGEKKGNGKRNEY